MPRASWVELITSDRRAQLPINALGQRCEFTIIGWQGMVQRADLIAVDVTSGMLIGEAADGHSVRIPIASIQRVEVRSFSGLRNTVVAFGVGAALVAAAVAVLFIGLARGSPG